MNFLALIPARYASSRFPGKPLALVKGKPMIQRVYEQTIKAFDNVCVATDDLRIFDAVKSFGGEAVMTSDQHQSGTDRCLEALRKYESDHSASFDVVINVQGDEPYIRPEQLLELKSCFDDENVELATLVKRIETTQELYNNNTPKVVISNEMNALYFSRAPIPFARDREVTDDYLKQNKYYKHIGLYGYRASCLEKICALPQSFLEKSEKLEQLRWLENGYKIKVALTDFQTHAVDTPEDLLFLNNSNF